MKKRLPPSSTKQWTFNAKTNVDSAMAIVLADGQMVGSPGTELEFAL